MSLVLEALDYYRIRKGQEPTQRCVEEGLSCSQRFERAYSLAIEEGLETPQALLKALKVTAEECAKINDLTQLKAYETLLIGTIAVVAGISSTGACLETDLCGDRETRESYGCTNNICDLCGSPKN